MAYVEFIPFTGHHGSIVIGKKGSTIKQLMFETGCNITARKPSPTEGRPFPFFSIEGPHEKAVNQATIRIQKLILSSMMRHEKNIQKEISETVERNQFLELKLSDQDEQNDIMDSEKDLWIRKTDDLDIEQLSDQFSNIITTTHDEWECPKSPSLVSDDEEDEEDGNDGLCVDMGN